MLIRRRCAPPSRPIRALLAVVMAAVMVAGVLVADLALGGAGRAVADGTGSCPPEILWCSVTGTGGGGPGGGTGTGPGTGDGSTGCTYQGEIVACYLEGLGFYNNANGCYFLREDPQPPPGDDRWKGNDPTQGAFYRVTCFTGAPPVGTGTFDPVEEFVKAADAGPSPLQLAEEALAEILLSPPAIHLAPSSDGVGGLVGLPVWMWTDQTPSVWGPLTNSKSFGAMTVTISAEGDSIAWDMGDGNTITCPNPGVAYTADAGASASPKCGYRYLKPSYDAKDGKYPITATTTWHVNWEGGGQSGVIVVTRTARTTVRINEAQVVVK